MRIGIDVGGTFTDFLLTTDENEFEVYKVLSTPPDPSEGVLTGLREMAQAHKLELSAFLDRVETIVHGTTVTTNAVLTHNGARTGLLTTYGVRDALEMRRGIREEQYNNRYTNVKPLIPRYLRHPVRGRLDHAGRELEALEEADIKTGLELFAREGVEAVAVCYMNAFADPEHEARTAQLVQKALPEAYLTTSTDLLPSIRFYDRLSTTVLNSYVGPILRSYLRSLTARLKEAGFGGVLLIMASNGGVIAPQVAIDTAAATLLSGPAGGPVAALTYAGLHGHRDCLTMDMGGTSFDAALIRDETPLVTTEGEIDRLRLALPMLGIHTIGAGGGSIAWLDEGGLLRMGPQSAGANPGPVSYGLDGERPTCTDANLLLGYLDPDYFAGGRMPLDREAAAQAVTEQIAEPLGLSLTEAVAGMYRVINVNMAAGVREITIKRGHDPRDFPLVVAGGAGPLHGCAIASELEIPFLLVPRESSIFCAAGMLMSDLSHDFVRTHACLLDDLDPARLRELYDEMEARGRELLELENIPEERMEMLPALDLRYQKQYHEVTVPVTMAEIARGDLAAMAARFHPEHNRLYGYSLEDEGTPVELINCRLRATGHTVKPRFTTEARTESPLERTLKGHREAYLPSARAFARVPVFDGLALLHGHTFDGPALVEQPNTTLMVMPEYRLRVDAYGSYVVYLAEREEEIARRLQA